MYLLDTNTIIDFCNARLPANSKQFLLTITEPCISVITFIELFSSTVITPLEKQKLEQFVQFVTVHDKISAEIVNKVIAIRVNYKTKLPDAIIAATALVHNLVLITRNTADFKNIEGLKIIDPHSL